MWDLSSLINDWTYTPCIGDSLFLTSKRFCIGVKVKVAQSCPALWDPMDCILQARILEWVTFPFSRGSSQPGIEPRSPALQVDSLPAEPQGKPKNTGVGSLSFLQQIFLTQESNQSLLHCRWILYQLSYQGNPENIKEREESLLKWTMQRNRGKQ